MAATQNGANEDKYTVKLMEDYLDAIEGMPNQLQRNVTSVRSTDIQFLSLMKRLSQLMERYQSQEDNSNDVIIQTLKQNTLREINECLIQCQQFQDHKLRQLEEMKDILESKQSQLVEDRVKLDSVTAASTSTNDALLLLGAAALPGGATPKRDSGDLLETASVASDSIMSESAEASRRSSRKAGGSDASTPASNTHRMKRPRRQKVYPDYVIHDSSDVGETFNSPTQPAPTTSIPTEKPEKVEKQSTKREKDKRELKSMSTPKSEPESSNSKLTTNSQVKTKRTRAKVSQSKLINVDPDEPTYCLCDQISYGEMIGCDNDKCILEWFHFQCVTLTTKPKGKWFCPNCRGDKQSVMKKDK